MSYQIYKSDRKSKKLVVTDGKHPIYFGATGYEDYTTHHDDERKHHYDERHGVREDWSDPTTAGFWSKWILWNKKTIKQSALDTEKRFGIHITLAKKKNKHT